jgi:DNA-binding NarL/FixJ family response regulator
MRSIKILLADDQALARDGIRLSVGRTSDLEIVGEASSGAQVLPLVARTDPDVVLLDVDLPAMDGLTCLERLRQRYSSVKVVMLSAKRVTEQIDAAFERGACGFIIKSIDASDLPSAIRQCVNGTLVFVPDRAREEPAGAASSLTAREVGILQGVARGLSNRAIGRELWLSDQTVKFHLSKIYRKLDVANRTEAARYALQHGLLGRVA